MKRLVRWRITVHGQDFCLVLQKTPFLVLSLFITCISDLFFFEPKASYSKVSEDLMGGASDIMLKWFKDNRLKLILTISTLLYLTTKK